MNAVAIVMSVARIVVAGMVIADTVIIAPVIAATRTAGGIRSQPLASVQPSAVRSPTRRRLAAIRM